MLLSISWGLDSILGPTDRNLGRRQQVNNKIVFSLKAIGFVLENKKYRKQLCYSLYREVVSKMEGAKDSEEVQTSKNGGDRRVSESLQHSQHQS